MKWVQCPVDKSIMGYTSAIPPDALPSPRLANPRRWRRALHWFVDSRAHRVCCMLFGLWVFNLFDLLLTILAHQQGLLDETNPIARTLLPWGPEVLTAFKLGLVGVASIVLFHYRRNLLSEFTSTSMLIVYALVAVRWRLCYELYFITHDGSVSLAELEQLNTWTSSLPIL
ncbi:MAG: DUF5658 family protein [Phycisphaerae bacterium]